MNTPWKHLGILLVAAPLLGACASVPPVTPARPALPSARESLSRGGAEVEAAEKARQRIGIIEEIGKQAPAAARKNV